jgi:hypothetical protein
MTEPVDILRDREILSEHSSEDEHLTAETFQ